MISARVWLATTGAVLLVGSACGSGSREERTQVHSSGAELAYSLVELGTETTRGPAAAASDELALIFGGYRIDGETGTAENGGVTYRPEGGASADTPAWPAALGAYSPAAVWTGEEFVVLGTPCTEVTGGVDEVTCERGIAAATLDASGETWTALPTDGLSDRDPTPTATHFGWSEGWALFGYEAFGLSQIVGYAPGKAEWRVFDEFDETYTYCFGGDALLRARIDEDESAVRVERLDTAGAEWQDAALHPRDTDEGVDDQLLCAGSELVFFDVERTDDGYDVTALSVFRTGSFQKFPLPGLDGFDPSLHLAETGGGTWVLWPSTGVGPPQVLSKGASKWNEVSVPTTESVSALVPVGEAVLVLSRSPDETRGTVVGVLSAK